MESGLLASKKKAKDRVFRPISKEKIKFENELEILVHKKVSSLCYGEEMIIDVTDNPALFIYAAKKSAYYNCMDDVKVILSKDKKKLTIKMEI